MGLLSNVMKLVIIAIGIAVMVLFIIALATPWYATIAKFQSVFKPSVRFLLSSLCARPCAPVYARSVVPTSFHRLRLSPPLLPLCDAFCFSFTIIY